MSILTVYADVTLAPMHDAAPKNLEELRAADPAEIAKLPRFDSRDYQIVTPVKDQGSSDLCWAYASVSASEASILREGIDPNATNNTLSLSAENLGYTRHNRGTDPLGNTKGEITGANWYNTSGNPGYGATVWSQWCGPIKKGVSVDLKNIYDNTDYRLENAIYIENEKDRDAIKRAIVQYGAITFSYNNKSERDYHNAKNETGSSAYPHACTIIGWDDSIPAAKFQPGGATQDGGWIIKNSYNSLPYFYLSYDCGSTSIVAFDYAPREEYAYNYFYDSHAQDFGLTLSIKGNNYVSNVFEAKKGVDNMSEYMKAVNVGIIGKNVTCEVEIYTDLQEMQDIGNISNITPTKGTLAAQKTEVFEHAGYHTIMLDTPIKIEQGSYFSVVIKVSSTAGKAAVRLTQESNLTYLNQDYWYKSNYAARIKAFTVCEENKSGCDTVGHNWDNGVVKEPAGCETPGSKLYTCTVCGETKSEELAATSHTVVEDAAITPTCTKEGKTAGSHCSICNKVMQEQETVPATGHAWDNGVVKEPAGCESVGRKLYTCAVCGETKNEEVAATGHTVVEDAAIAPTCTKEGKTAGSHCSVCNKVMQEQKIVSAAGHKWENWEITVNPTQSKMGAAVRLCQNDNTHKENHMLPVLSDTTVWTVGDHAAPTENRDGWQEYISEYGTVTVILPWLPPAVFSAQYIENGNVLVTAPRPGIYCMMFAAYENGRLHDITMVHVTFQESGKQVIVPPDGFGGSNIGGVRVFFWNTLSDMLPLCPVI